MAEATILEAADDIIHGDRAKDYGHPRINFDRTAKLIEAYLDGRDFRSKDDDGEERFRDEFTAHDYAMCMVLVKVARQADGYHRDSSQDIIGYAALDAIVAGDDPYQVDEG